MKNRKENQFINKFRFLHSQESSEEISWSCSDSSDYEYCDMPCRTLLNNNTINGIGRKRKRVHNNKKRRKNTSHLDITIVDTSSERESFVKSPILMRKSTPGVIQKSPHLQNVSKITNQKTLNDSALTSFRVSVNKNFSLKSPIIPFKNITQKASAEVRKQLFKDDECHGNKEMDNFESDRNTSPILSKKRNCYSKIHGRMTNDINGEKYFEDCQIKYKETDRIKDSDNEEINIESLHCSSSEESVSKKSHIALVAKVKSYFENHFVSDSSQLSISECETLTPRNSSKSSNSIDIATLKTQEKGLVSLLKTLPIDTFESHIDISKKKLRNKKGGLAYRLTTLLKKQNSSVSLWQHERFLAANSNFIIPKEEFLVFRIRNVYFQYGIYLLEIVNKDDEFFSVIINSIYVNDNVFQIDNVLKIYEPYKIVDTNNNCKIICNVCKFECEKLIILSK